MADLWKTDILKIDKALSGQMRLVGGCVRDYLLGQEPQDVDIATPVLPKEVLRLLKQARLKAYPIALGHGVVAVEIDGKTVEITTLRTDVYTETGKEQVRFITDYRADAVRRDFTINAMYLDRESHLYDYWGGQADLFAHKVRFIGNPLIRMTEDPLRILRYIRFWARFGGELPDESVVALFPKLRDGLTHISAGRKCKEFLKILMCNRVASAIELMDRAGLLSEFILKTDTEALQAFLPSHPQADPLTRLKILSGGKIAPIWQFQKL